MKFIGVLFTIILEVVYVESRILPMDMIMPTNMEELIQTQTTQSEEHQEKNIGLKNYEEKENDEYGFDVERKRVNERTKKPCAIVVLSNIQNPSMQSLLRKYRYDANGVLIPSSVRYFIKLPQGLRSSPLLVPLNDKAFSPIGGFIRYYKEVPPIPQSW